MTLATLNHIYSLLEREEKARREVKMLAFQAWEQATGERAGNAPDLREQLEKARASWNEANNALRDFEAQDW